MNKKPSILVVDDNEAERYVISRLLRQANFEVQEAATGEEALEKVQTQPDLVVLDINLPGINGFEVCRRIRQMQTASHIPVVHLSATYKDSEAMVKGLNTGADSYLTHPVDPPVLIAMIQSLLRTRRAERELADLNRNLEARVQERTSKLFETTEALKREVTQRERAQARLEDVNKDLQDFIYVASHDLQEPLRKIQTFGNWITEHESEHLSERGHDYLARLEVAIAQMQGQIEDLVTLSQITNRVMSHTWVNLKEVVQETCILLAKPIRQTQAKIDIGNLPTIEADREQMRQLFQNLIDNALKFFREGVPLHIEIQGEIVKKEEPALCQITVKDNGIGFEEKYLDRIFKVFQRLHQRDRYSGRGIGLAICQKIVEQHKGQITAQSKLEEETTFIITLPMKQA